MADDPLIKAFDYYLKHQAELVKKYDGKFVVIKDEQVLGAYDDQEKAISESAKRHPVGSFLVQRVSSGDSAYSQTFHSRVLFT